MCPQPPPPSETVWGQGRGDALSVETPLDEVQGP